jgi:hypothetical protein
MKMSTAETSTTPTVEELMKKLEKLTTVLNKLKTKDKKGKKNASQVTMMIPHMKRKSPPKQRGTRKSVISPPIMICLLITITCIVLQFVLPCPLARLHILTEQTIINGSIA